MDNSRRKLKTKQTNKKQRSSKLFGEKITLNIMHFLLDMDNEGLGNEEDNCVSVFNPEQINIDFDTFGDLCDNDIDNDSILNEQDNCINVSNTNQLDYDSDGIGYECDEAFDSNIRVSSQQREPRCILVHLVKLPYKLHLLI